MTLYNMYDTSITVTAGTQAVIIICATTYLIGQTLLRLVTMKFMSGALRPGCYLIKSRAWPQWRALHLN